MHILKIFLTLFSISINAMETTNTLGVNLKSGKIISHLYIGVTNSEHARINDNEALYFSNSPEVENKEEIIKNWGSFHAQGGYWGNITKLKEDHPYIIGDFNEVSTLKKIGNKLKFKKIYIDHSTIKLMRWNENHFQSIADMLLDGGELVFDTLESNSSCEDLKIASLIKLYSTPPETEEKTSNLNKQLNLKKVIEQNKFYNQLEMSGLFTIKTTKESKFPFESNWKKGLYDVTIATKKSSSSEYNDPNKIEQLSEESLAL